MISRLKKFRPASSFPVAAIVLAAALVLSPAGARATTATEAIKATEVSHQEHPESAVLNRVMLTVLGVWAALAVYLFLIDRKLSRIERERE